MQTASLPVSLVNVGKFSIFYVKCIKQIYLHLACHEYEIFRSNGAIENNSQVFSADKNFVDAGCYDPKYTLRLKEVHAW